MYIHISITIAIDEGGKSAVCVDGVIGLEGPTPINSH